MLTHHYCIAILATTLKFSSNWFSTACTRRIHAQAELYRAIAVSHHVSWVRNTMEALTTEKLKEKYFGRLVTHIQLHTYSLVGRHREIFLKLESLSLYMA